MSNKRKILFSKPFNNFDPEFPLGQNIGDYWAWSMRRHWNWGVGYMTVVRVSDGQLRYLHFALGEYTTTLNTITSTAVASKTGTSTLGVWGAGTDVWVSNIHAQNSTGSIKANDYIYVSTPTLNSTAYIMKAGALIMDTNTGTFPILDFFTNGNCVYRPNGGNLNSFIGSTNDGTVLIIANNPTDETNLYIWSTTTAASGTDDVLTLRADRRSGVGVSIFGHIRVDDINYNIVNDSKIANNSLQRLVMIKDATDVWGFINGIQQGSKVPWSGTMNDTQLNVLGRYFGSFFAGEFFELVVTNQDEDTAGNFQEINNNLKFIFG